MLPHDWCTDINRKQKAYKSLILSSVGQVSKSTAWMTVSEDKVLDYSLCQEKKPRNWVYHVLNITTDSKSSAPRYPISYHKESLQLSLIKGHFKTIFQVELYQLKELCLPEYLNNDV